MPYYVRIREERVRLGLTQRQVADLLEMHQQQYQRYEQGQRDLPTPVLIRLTEIFKTSADYLLGLTDVPKPGN